MRARCGNVVGPAGPALDTEALMARRRREADEFYAVLQQDIADADRRLVQRILLRQDDAFGRAGRP